MMLDYELMEDVTCRLLYCIPFGANASLKSFLSNDTARLYQYTAEVTVSHVPCVTKMSKFKSVGHHTYKPSI